MEHRLRGFREWLAYKIAPWVYVDRREEREEAFKMLAEIAYCSRDAVWTSPTVLVRAALDRASDVRSGVPPEEGVIAEWDELIHLFPDRGDLAYEYAWLLQNHDAT